MRLFAAAASLALLLPVAGCGGGGEGGTFASATETPEPGGTLRIGIRGPIGTLDPLLAVGRSERLATRQIHEPLNSLQAGPFGQTTERPGLARSFASSAGDTIWTATLRRGVRFGNGEPLDADAVLANVERWLAVPPGPELVPELSVADSPQPGQVRFQLNGPAPRFPRRLASPRLGLIAPEALAGLGSSSLPITSTRTGTGPFELRERGDGRTLFARNASWWGTSLGLGPGVDQVEVIDQVSERSEVELLLTGSIEVAADLDPAEAKRVAANPLLTVVRGRGTALGMERSVRGIESADLEQPLADVWLTDIR